MESEPAGSDTAIIGNLLKTVDSHLNSYMIQFKIIKSDSCGCCKPLIEKMQRYCDETGCELQIVDISDVEEIPLDLTGIPYTIVLRDGMFVTSFQGDSPEDILRERIEYILSKHKELIGSECDKT